VELNIAVRRAISNKLSCLHEPPVDLFSISKYEPIADRVKPSSFATYHRGSLDRAHYHAVAARFDYDDSLAAIDRQALGDDVDELAVEVGFAG